MDYMGGASVKILSLVYLKRVSLWDLQSINPHKYRQNERPTIQNRRSFDGPSEIIGLGEIQ